jgi:hypothetical protein
MDATLSWMKTIPQLLGYTDLSHARREAVDRVVEKVRQSRLPANEILNDGSEAYAYPGAGNEVCFGLNGTIGHCVARGVMK